MTGTSRSHRVLVGALVVGGLLAGLVGLGGPVNADDTSTTTSTTTTTILDTTSEESTTTTSEVTTTEPTTTEQATVPPATVPSATAPPVESVIPPMVAAPVTLPARVLVGAAVVAAPAVPIGEPVDASRTPARGTQVQLHPLPPPPPPSELDLPANSGAGRRVVYSKTLQRVWVVDEAGTVIKTHKVSGKQTPRDPSPGTYSVWSRSLNTCAIHNPTICWKYMVRFAQGARGGNIGFHEIPFQYGRPVQTVDQLGDALSGGCVRQSTPDAIWMWEWAQLGTVVVVLP